MKWRKTEWFNGSLELRGPCWNLWLFGLQWEDYVIRRPTGEHRAPMIQFGLGPWDLTWFVRLPKR